MACDPLKRPTVRYRGRRVPVPAGCLEMIHFNRQLGLPRADAVNHALYFNRIVDDDEAHRQLVATGLRRRDHPRRPVLRPYYPPF